MYQLPANNRFQRFGQSKATGRQVAGSLIYSPRSPEFRTGLQDNKHFVAVVGYYADASISAYPSTQVQVKARSDSSARRDLCGWMVGNCPPYRDGASLQN